MSREVESEVDLDKLFASIDAMDVESFVGFLTEDGTFRFGSAPPVSGREAVGAAVGGFFSSIEGLRLDLQRVIREGDTIVCEGEVAYTRQDGSEITLPFCDVFEVSDGLIATYLIYMDIGPLFAAT